MFDLNAIAPMPALGSTGDRAADTKPIHDYVADLNQMLGSLNRNPAGRIPGARDGLRQRLDECRAVLDGYSI